MYKLFRWQHFILWHHTMAYQVTFWWDNDVMLPTFASSVKQLQADLFIHLDTLYWLWAISLCFYSLIWGSNSLEAKWGGEIHLKEIWWYTNMYMIVGTVKNSTEYKIKKIYFNTVNPSGHLRFLINTKQTLYRYHFAASNHLQTLSQKIKPHWIFSHPFPSKDNPLT
jgi:hypothetical protein